MNWFRIPRLGARKGIKIFDGKSTPRDSVSSPGDIWFDMHNIILKMKDQAGDWKAPVDTVRGLEAELAALSGLHREISSVVYEEGSRAFQSLLLAENVADTNTFTIGDDTFEIEVVNTDTNKNVANEDEAAIDDETDPVVIKMEDELHGIEAGDLIRIDNEIMLVLAVEDALITASRAHSGTTIATHVKNSDVYKGTGYTEGNIPVGLVTTLTPAAAAVAIEAVVNAYATEPVTADIIEEEENRIILVTHKEFGPSDIAVSGSLASGSHFLGEQLVGGMEPGPKKITSYVHTVTTEEGVLGVVNIPIEFEPGSIIMQLQDSNGAIKPFAGTAVFKGEPKRIVVENPGAGDSFEATDEISIIAFE